MRPTAQKRQSGFTLIEMMFTVAIVGVLASVAMPSYSLYVLKARRTEAVVGLHRVWDMQQSYYAGHDEQFATNFDELGFSGVERVDASTVRGQRYVYRISRPWGEKTWYCSATSNLDGDDWPDVLVTGWRPPEE